MLRGIPFTVFLLTVTACSASVGRAARPSSVASSSDGTPATQSVPTETAESDKAPPQTSPSAAPKDVEPTTDAARVATSEPSESAEAKPLPSGTTILQIGDSFAGALGIDLDRDLKEEGVRGVLRYETSTYIPTWASNKDLAGYLNRYDPDLVLITLGANELEIPDPKARIPTIHRLVSRLEGRACVWVAPPLWEGARPDLLATIRDACSPCVYLDSSALVPGLERMRDHIHPSTKGRKVWAKAVLEWLRAHRDPSGSRPWDLKP